MATVIALFRGINVGKAKRIAMADLRELLVELGYGNPRTLLNSGNAVFDLPRGLRSDSAARLEQAVQAKLGVSSRITLLTDRELGAIVAGNPLLEVGHDHSRLLITVPTDPKDLSLLAPLAKQRWAPDVLAIGARAVYGWCPAGVLESPLAIAVGKAMKDKATTRNWATIQKLHALAGGGAG